MSGIRYLLITRDNKVYKIAIPKRNAYRAIPELHDQLVLEVILYYETKNRKPYEMLNVSFDRLHLNSDGRFVLTDDEGKERFRNFDLFAFQTPQSLAEKEGPLPLPSAIVLPTDQEKEALKKYIKNELPKLYETGVYEIENAIRHSTEVHDKFIDLVKQAAKIKNIK